MAYPIMCQEEQMKPSEIDAVERTEQKLEIVFRSKELLRRALTHRSYAHEAGLARTNERLELLGDAVIGLVITEELFLRFAEMEEGDLSQLKSFLVSRRFQAKAARELGIDECMLLGVSEEKTGGRRRASILAGVLEAVIGAVYLDSGLECVKQLLQNVILNRAEGLASPWELKDPKSKLQELVQGQGLSQPSYKVASVTGPDHRPIFTVIVLVGGKELGSGKGSSKKEAERVAAGEAFTVLGARGQGVGSAPYRSAAASPAE